MEEEIKTLCIVCLTVISSLIYCYFVSAKLFPCGKWRLVSLLPVIFIFSILPLYTTSAFCTGVTSFFLTWLANFKLLLFAFDRGPIFDQMATKSLPLFIAMAALPFKVKPRNLSLRNSKKLPLNLGTEIPISVILLSALSTYKSRLHPTTLLISYCCLLFLLIEFLIGVCGVFVEAFFGLAIEPASDEPYLSISVREFWGRRWNLAVNEILRDAVYRPVRSVTAGKKWEAAAAGMAVFVVSGIMHEVLLWYVTRAKPSWEMTMFFVLQGGFVMAEYGLKLNRKRFIPWFVGWPVTLAFVIGTSFWLFFPPLIRNGVDVRLLGEFQFAVNRVREFGSFMGFKYPLK